MSTLTDRYVHAVTAQLPESSRAEVARELRASIADACDDRPDLDAVAAERAALIALGAPDRLAAEYGSVQHLIGPALYPRWKQLIVRLVAIIPTVLAVLVVVARAASGDLPADAAGSTTAVFSTLLGTWLEVALQVAFWVTVGFAIAERAGARRVRERTAWDPDSLPDPADRVGVGSSIGGVAGYSLGAALLAFAPAVLIVNGQPTPLFAPEAWPVRWLFVALLAGMAALHLALLITRRWTRGIAFLNVGLNAALIALAGWTLLGSSVLSTRAATTLDGLGGSGTWRTVTWVIIFVACVWDAASALRRTRRK